MKQIIRLFMLGIPFLSLAQQEKKKDVDPELKIYRAEATRVNNLVHTKLEVRFDYENAWMYGKVWVTLQPHFFATDSLTLNAKGMVINEVALVKGTIKNPLVYKYDGSQLQVNLDRNYQRTETYTIYIDYIAKPNELKNTEGSAAISGAKGLYFINPKGIDKNKPTQIWTQGETEATSVWVPTIDRPNQKTTQELSMTVPDKYVTLSNGIKTASKKNTDGTRTDTWKMDLPHSPYLFFMGVGEYDIIKDTYKGKEVAYYVEKEYASVARRIFGLTPEMMTFFSNKLGVDYPWQKYSQIVGRDYVSGAMENTTSTLHQESAYQNARQLSEANDWESVIAHELFHQWFGDLVTCESWSNLTVNESFADLSETLWTEYKYGKDAGDEYNFNAMKRYIYGDPEDFKKDLVRFHYKSQEDMFDNISYPKGGRILNMLRNYLGEEAFYASLKKYLTDNKYKTGEAHQLRLAFEAVTGQDLNWFWNEWYFNNGHPVVDINYMYDDAARNVQVIIAQKQDVGQKVFTMPLKIDIYQGKNKTRHAIWMTNRKDTFLLPYGGDQRPTLVNVDADKKMLWEKKDNKTAENYLAQFSYAPGYMDRREALHYFSQNGMVSSLSQGLDDRYHGIRSYTLDRLADDSTITTQTAVLSKIKQIAQSEPHRRTRAKAIAILASTGDRQYESIFTENINDSSYSISAACLRGLMKLQPTEALNMAKKLSTDLKGDLGEVVTQVMIENGGESEYDIIATYFDELPLSEEKLYATSDFAGYLARISSIDKIKNGVDKIITFKQQIPSAYASFTDPIIKEALLTIAKAKGGDVADYIEKALQ
jgi:aminopeptidase N